MSAARKRRLLALSMSLSMAFLASAGEAAPEPPPKIKRCDQPVIEHGELEEGDLGAEVDRRLIAFRGPVTKADFAVLHAAVKSAINESGEIGGRSVCFALNIRNGDANYVTDSIPPFIAAIREVSVNAQFRAMWGGGGLTIVGWMPRNDLAALKSVANGSGPFPIDTGSVGVLENLPGRVRLRMERVSFTSSTVVQIEQIHPNTEPITLSTTSTKPLLVCPGSWRGVTPSAVWKSPRCRKVDASRSIVLRGSGNAFTHLSFAIRPVRGSIANVDLDLRYTAVDPAFECYVGGLIGQCDLLPQR